MGWVAPPLPVVWAQATGAPAPTPVSNTAAMAALALRRWCGSLTLTAPTAYPGLTAVWAGLAALGVLFVLALLFQGPGRALAQTFDVVGHVRLLGRAASRLRRCGRLLTVITGLTVLSWTGSQALGFRNEQGREDLIRLSRTRGLAELAFEHGTYAALTPLRDLCGLGSNIALLAVATVLLFRATADTWSGNAAMGGLPRISAWASVGWTCGAVYILYRLVAMFSPSPELPLGGCLIVEAAVVPLVMAVVDGVLLAWVVIELRDALFNETDDSGFAPVVHEAADLVPAAALACLLTLPGRYAATAIWLGWYHLPSSVNATPLGGYLRWQLGPGLALLAAAALPFTGVVGAVAWTQGSPWEAARVFCRMIAKQGARLAVVTALAGLACGLASAAAYLAVLSMPTTSWLLSAADSYAHYATLPVGLWALAALVELAELSLPEAALAPAEPADVADDASAFPEVARTSP